MTQDLAVKEANEWWDSANTKRRREVLTDLDASLELADEEFGNLPSDVRNGLVEYLQPEEDSAEEEEPAEDEEPEPEETP